MIQLKNPRQLTSKKILDEKTLIKKLNFLRKEGLKIGLCVGGYDLLHAGHILHLKSAKNLCDVLIVGITSDKFTEERKGRGRPIYSEQLRIFSVSQLESVDFVVVSPYKKAVELIKSLKPDYYIKGPDYEKKSTPGITAEREAIKKVGGSMKYTQDEKLSTSKIIEYIKNLDQK